jgi:hypothetical protein
MLLFPPLCIAQDLDDVREEFLGSLSPDVVLGDPDWDAVRVWTALDTRGMLEATAKNMVKPWLNKVGEEGAGEPRGVRVGRGWFWAVLPRLCEVQSYK